MSAVIGAGAGTVNHAGAGAAAALDEPLAGKLAERAAHGHPRHAVIFSQLVLGRQLGAEAESAAENAVTQDEIDLLCLRFAEPIAHTALPLEAARQRSLYLVFFSVQYWLQLPQARVPRRIA